MQPTETLWRAYSDQLLSFIRGRVNDPSHAEDILQDVFLKMHEQLHTLKDDQKLQSWMYRIARNAIIDHYRSKKPFKDLPEELPELQPAEGDQTHREVAGWLVPMIHLLPEPYREADRLSEIVGLPHKEVANRQGIALSAAKSRVLRGKIMLKKLITDCCQLEFDQRGRVVDYERRGGECSC